jgi:hypothetical protein
MKKTNKNPIIYSDELTDLFNKALDNQELDHLSDELDPSWTFQTNEEANGANDAIDFLACNGAKLPSIIAIDTDYETVWSLLPANRIKSILTETLKEQVQAEGEQEKLAAETRVVALEKQLVEAKKALAANKGSKSK